MNDSIEPKLGEVRDTLRELDTTGFDEKLAAFANNVWSDNVGGYPAEDEEREQFKGYGDDSVAAVNAGRVLLAIALVAAEQLMFREGIDVKLNALVCFDARRRWPEDGQINVVRRRAHNRQRPGNVDGELMRIQVETHTLDDCGWPDCWLFDVRGDKLLKAERVSGDEEEQKWSRR